MPEVGGLSVPALIVACGMVVALPVFLGERLGIQFRRRRYAEINLNKDDEEQEEQGNTKTLPPAAFLQTSTKAVMSDLLVVSSFVVGALFSAVVAEGTPWATEADGSLTQVFLLLFFLSSIFSFAFPPREGRDKETATRQLPGAEDASPKKMVPVGRTARKVWGVAFYAAIVFTIISPWWTPLYLGVAFQGIVIVRIIFSGGKNVPGGFLPVKKDISPDKK